MIIGIAMLLFAALSILPSQGGIAHAAPAIDRAALLEAICQHETRGEPEPHAAIGDGGEAIGRCQVQIGTAAWLLGMRDYQITDAVRAGLRRVLLDPEINEQFAALALAECLALTRTLARAVYCYAAGPRARWSGPTNYTKSVLLAYAEARWREQWRRRK